MNLKDRLLEAQEAELAAIQAMLNSQRRRTVSVPASPNRSQKDAYDSCAGSDPHEEWSELEDERVTETPYVEWLFCSESPEKVDRRDEPDAFDADRL